MKTLYQRLSEENILKLKKYSELYPNIHISIIDALTNNYYMIELKIVDASALFDAIYPMQLFDLNKLYNLFDNE